MRYCVVGIDPGYDRCGIAVAERDAQNANKLIFSTCIIPPKESSSKRLGVVGKSLNEILQKYSPSVVAIEKIFFSNNQKTALRVAEARGAILAVAAESEIPIYEYSPQDIKIAMTGYGASSKIQVADMVKRLVTIRPGIKKDDEFDAIAIALTHLAVHRGLK